MDTTTLPVRPSTAADLAALIGKELGPTEWYEITQERVNAFADATGDHQWIHIDPERAAASPLGSTSRTGCSAFRWVHTCPADCLHSTVSRTV